MKRQLHARLEALLIRMAARILSGRNVKRSMVVSRRDNNEMFEMGYTLDAIAKRIETAYKDE